MNSPSVDDSPAGHPAVGIIFDLDGVLIDSGEAHWQAWRALGERIGRPLRTEQFSATFGRRNEDCIYELFGPQADRAEALRLADWKESLYRDSFAKLVRPVAGAVELVRACFAAGVRVGIGSSAPRENLDLAVESLGIRPFVGASVSGNDVSHGKPDPQVFLRAAERVGVAPNGCVVVEDAPAGIAAAIAGGMIAVALVGSHARSELGAATTVIDHLSELTPARLRSLVAARAGRM
jgi:beta-phosphoglucomutase